jgi:glycosyltransferase involved in cell wall biosynthesis
LPEAIEHGATGFLVPRAQLHRLAEAILEILALPEARRRAIAQAARERVATHFNAETEAAGLARILARLGLYSQPS